MRELIMDTQNKTQREIKFRALSNGKLYDCHVCNFEASTALVDVEGGAFPQWCKVEKFPQYTGKHDKNGKEIYEGDVLSYGKQAFRRVVIWRSPSFGYLDMAGVFWELNRYLNTNEATEVCGNKFENPELMESK